MPAFAVRSLVAILAVLPALANDTATPHSPTTARRSLGFEDRMVAQRAIEQVYWNHRIWPAENPNPKPPLSEVMSDDAIRARVEDYLAKSAALERWWKHPVTAEQLQAEMERMAKQTKNGAMLQELFRALGDDPSLIAETLARQTLVDRLIRSWYASDSRFHGELKAKAEAAQGACADAGCMKSMGGEYRETRFTLATETAPRRTTADRAEVRLDSGEWKDRLASFAARLGARELARPTGTPSGVEETPDAFVVTAVLARREGDLITASVTWPKRTFDAWWEGERRAAGTQAGPASGTFTLPRVPLTVCTNDTWPQMSNLEPRVWHTAVWTGTEMIVWGGGVAGGTDVNSGGRYNPATDSWTPTSTGANVPRARRLHSAVWTGTQMIVWGGEYDIVGGGGLLNDGGRYDPASDSWTPTSTGTNVPAPRINHTAVWTGTQMIVWGGSNVAVVNTGGRYNPSTDSWLTTSVAANVPDGRDSHTAVWAGSAMLVWGGRDGSGAFLSTGGRYVPGSNSWTPTSTGANLPAARAFHTAVWTGTDMIVWGGADNAHSLLNTGARYKSSTNSWTSTSTGANLPSGRLYHTAVWTGTAMIVWGGEGAAAFFNTGGRYTPSSDSWAATSTGTNVPAARHLHTAVWTGTEMIVWGGGSTYSNSGGRYAPGSDSWTPTSAAENPPTGRIDHTAVWTGTEMIVWGGQSNFGPPANTGGRYNPATDAWTPTSIGTGVPSARFLHTAVWTGTEMIVWGGGGYLNSGGRYNPSTDSWLATSIAPNVPTGRYGHTSVWTGAEMIVWGGYYHDASGDHYENSGGRYDPSADSWLGTSVGTNVPKGRIDHTAVWTGSEMVVWGGYYYDSADHYLNSGGRYDPSADAWLETSAGTDVPSARKDHTAVWTGTEMIVWGGYFYASGEHYENSGGRYDPAADVWTPSSTGTNVPDSRRFHSAVWTGTEMIVWGGLPPANTYLNSGGRYDPTTDGWTSTSLGVNVPSARLQQSAVWTGTEMIVWGGDDSHIYLDTGGRYCACPNGRIFYRDADGDGSGDAGSSVASCDGSIPAGYVDNRVDCNDGNPNVHPGASEINDGIDNQCPGDPGFGTIDELGETGSVAADKATFSWAAQQNASSYQLARATSPDFTVACTLQTGPSPSFQDSESPAPGTAFYYIARAAAPYVGSWGRTSSGVERTTSCP